MWLVYMSQMTSNKFSNNWIKMQVARGLSTVELLLIKYEVNTVADWYITNAVYNTNCIKNVAIVLSELEVWNKPQLN